MAIAFQVSSDPNGVWKLYVVDDTINNGGFIGSGWSISIKTGIPASQVNGITTHGTYPAPTPASTYPWKLEMDGAAGTISDITVTLHGFTDNHPLDIDILLVGPAGQKMILMSDVGGASSVNGLTLTFSDTAPTSVPSDGPLASGVYKPTNVNPGITFPDPAPAGPYSTNFAALDGTSPNGTWQLYVSDNTIGDSGSIDAWSLTVRTTGGLADTSQPCGTSVGKYYVDDYSCGGLRQISHHMIFTSPDVNGHKLFTFSIQISGADIHMYSGLTLADGVGFYVSGLDCPNGIQITMTGLGGSGFNLLGNNSMQNALIRGFPDVPTLRALYGSTKFRCTVIQKATS